jgi:hypothetical protein
LKSRGIHQLSGKRLYERLHSGEFVSGTIEPFLFVRILATDNSRPGLTPITLLLTQTESLRYHVAKKIDDLKPLMMQMQTIR